MKLKITDSFEGGRKRESMQTDRLLKKIENQRNLLYAKAKDRRLVDPEVVQMSQKLDRLLNQYHSLVTRDKSSRSKT
ncbi:aspartyl-phosphate phosphatase Spo0E family protein [Desulfitobacterium sp.]|uniref:aspartyl-phosphate phosphatase Spo0E family protein n=1 Tax=Desulfitobacterium sp. TaxID=49981 RepID=UPI002D802625|nr:aspartyl-phosphate phosphatase Spo0E family protein [Desulfitobacterium sp.]